MNMGLILFGLFGIIVIVSLPILAWRWEKAMDEERWIQDQGT